MKLIVGLGNPGEKYRGNRHNIGFMAVDEIARGYSFAPWKKRFQGYTSEGQIGLERCILLKPSTYMNESGRAVGEALRFYKLPITDVIVIHDEIDLKPGAIRVKKGGGNAGHNGLKSISAHVGNDYVRVRLGVDHPGDKAVVAHYVLQDFAKADREWLLPLLDGVARGMTKLVEGNEAAFLAEAARGRKPQAAKPNGAAAPSADAGKTSQTNKISQIKEQVVSPQVGTAAVQTSKVDKAEPDAARPPVSEADEALLPQEAAPADTGEANTPLLQEHVAIEAASEQPIEPVIADPVLDEARAAAQDLGVELARAEAAQPPLFETVAEDRLTEADALTPPRRIVEPRATDTATPQDTSRKPQGNVIARWFRTFVFGQSK